MTPQQKRCTYCNQPLRPLRVTSDEDTPEVCDACWLEDVR